MEDEWERSAACTGELLWGKGVAASSGTSDTGVNGSESESTSKVHRTYFTPPTPGAGTSPAGDSEPVTSHAPSKPLEAVTTDSSDTYIYAGHLEAPPLLADLPALQEEPAIVKTRRRYTLLYVNIICPLKFYPFAELSRDHCTNLFQE